MSEQPPHLPFWRSAAFREGLMRHRFQLIGAMLGLLLAVGFLTLGFWRTLLIAILMLVGFTIGSLYDGSPRLKYRLAQFYHFWIEDNPFMK